MCYQYMAMKFARFKHLFWMKTSLRSFFGIKLPRILLYFTFVSTVMFLASSILLSTRTVKSTHRHLEARNRKVFTKESALQNENGLDKGNFCQKHRRYVYVKTHKTGSTTVSSVLNSHNDKDTIKMPRKRCVPFSGGYPGRYNFEFAQQGDFEVVDGHFRYNPEEFRRHMPPDTKYITIIREPWSNFQSCYNYYKPDTRVSQGQCSKSPMNYVTNGEYVALEDFVVLANEVLDPSISWYFRFKNYQAHDLGLDPMMTDDVIINREILKLDEKLDLVMIMEYMEESLILLKNELCMNWEDISKPGRNAREYEKVYLSTEAQNAFYQLDNVDIALYKYFNETLWKKVDEYGRTKMAQDVITLRSKMKTQDVLLKEPRSEPKFGRENYRPTTKQELTQRLACYDTQASKLADYMMQNSGGCYEPT